MEKKKWVNPVLTVLTREGDSSERILSCCKAIGGFGVPGDPFNTHVACFQETPGQASVCAGCMGHNCS